jgi:putative ABC transport system permease protein
MLISFLVVFAVFTLLVYNYQNYKKPMGINDENVWVVNYSNALKTDNSDSLRLFYETLRRTLKSMPQVKEISFSSNNIPFSQTVNQSGIAFNGKKTRSKTAIRTPCKCGSWKDVGSINRMPFAMTGRL